MIFIFIVCMFFCVSIKALELHNKAQQILLRSYNALCFSDQCKKDIVTFREYFDRGMRANTDCVCEQENQKSNNLAYVLLLALKMQRENHSDVSKLYEKEYVQPMMRFLRKYGVAFVTDHFNLVEDAQRLDVHEWKVFKRCAQANTPEKNGLFPLAYAMLCKKKAATKRAILWGANLCMCDSNGNTPLHWAARDNQKRMAQMLVQHGAPIEAHNKFGRSPLVLGVTKGSIDFVKIVGPLVNLNTNDTRGFPLAVYAVLKNRVGILRFLCEQGVDVNAFDMQGFTLLHWAVFQNNLSLVRILLDFEADPLRVAQGNFSPLVYADKENRVIAQTLRRALPRIQPLILRRL